MRCIHKRARALLHQHTSTCRGRGGAFMTPKTARIGAHLGAAAAEQRDRMRFSLVSVRTAMRSPATTRHDVGMAQLGVLELVPTQVLRGVQSKSWGAHAQ